MSRRERAIKQIQSNGQWRQLEDVRIVGHSRGRWDLQHPGRSVVYPAIGGTWPDADNAVGEDARLAFAYGNPLMPVFFSRGSRPRSRIVIEEDLVLTWPFYRYSPAGIGSIAAAGGSSGWAEVGQYPVITRIRDAGDLVQFVGSAAWDIGTIVGSLGPWLFGGTEQERFWLDFSLAGESLITLEDVGALPTDSGEGHWDGLRYHFPLPQTESTPGQRITLRNAAGAVWTYDLPEHTWDDGDDGGGDDGGGDDGGGGGAN